MALGQEGWRPLTGQIGGLADVPNGKGEAKQMSNSVKREEALSCFLAGSTGGKSSLHEMDSQPRAKLYPEPGLDLNIGFHICMYFFSISSYGFCTFRSNASLKGQGLVGKRSGKADHLIYETQATCLRSPILQRKESLSFTHLPLQLPRHNYKIYPRETK